MAFAALVAWAVALCPRAYAKEQDRDTEVKKAYEDVFAKRIEAATRTPTTDDDLALASEMIALAEGDEDPRLVKLLCEGVYELCKGHPAGSESAIKAMRIMTQKVPAEAEEGNQRISDLLQERFRSAKADGRAASGRALMVHLEGWADTQMASNPKGAARNYQLALTAARATKSDALAGLEAKLSVAQARVKAQDDIKRAAAKLESSPDDRAAATQIAELYTLDLDDPDQALAYGKLLEKGLAAIVRMASSPIEDLTGKQCLELADWYRSHVKAGSAARQRTATSRAKVYYQEVLSRGDVSDTDLAKSKLYLQQFASAPAAADRPQASPAKRVGRLQVDTEVECPEASAVLEEAAGLDPKMLAGVRQVTLVSVHNAVDLQHTGGDPVVVDGSYAEQALVGTDKNIFMFGPSEKLALGEYLIIYRFEPMERADAGCSLEVCNDTKTIIVRNVEPAQLAKKRWLAFGIVAKIKDDSPVQYRFWPRERKFAMDRVYVFKVR